VAKHPPFPAVILAGGLSRRMGQDKAALVLAGIPLALRIAQRLQMQASEVRLNAPAEHPLRDALPIVPDTRLDRPGPLAGVLAGMELFRDIPNSRSHILTAPCDTPFLPKDLAAHLAGEVDHNTIVVAASAGRIHPVTALWPVSLATDLENWLEDPDHRRVFDFIDRHRVKTVEFAPWKGPFGPVDPFFNINTTEDLALAEAILERGDL
jgi:molybdopterin-guanine dinucleotide biosynthesis protein A